MLSLARSKSPPAVSGFHWARRLLLSEYFALWLSALYFLCLWPLTPEFASSGNLANILFNMLPLLVVATGQTFVLIGAGIDLSATAIIALASVLGASAVTMDGGWLGHGLGSVVGSWGLMILVGLAVGSVNGLAVTRAGMPPFIVTLTMLMFCGGLAIWATQSRSIGNLPLPFTRLGGNLWWAFAITLTLCALAHFVLAHSILGRWLYATGQNRSVAWISGVPVHLVIFSTYLFSGLCAALASILYTGRLETGSPVLGEKILLDVIGATVIGGTSLYGGRGKILWTVGGVLFITLVDNSLNLQGRSFFVITMVKGAVILLAAILDATRQRWAAAA